MDKTNRLRLHRPLFEQAAHLAIFRFHLAGDGCAAVFQRLGEVDCLDSIDLFADPVQGVEPCPAHNIFEVSASETLGLCRDLG